LLEVDSIIALLRLIEAESAYYLDKIEEPSLVKKFCVRNQMTKLSTLTQRSDFCAHSGIPYFDPYKMVGNQIYLPHLPPEWQFQCMQLDHENDMNEYKLIPS
jgi:hypothetical protein